MEMKYFYDKGHRIIGVEFSPKAVEEFFDENKLTYTSESVDGVGMLYKVISNI